jgi:hypothetical protein
VAQWEHGLASRPAAGRGGDHAARRRVPRRGTVLLRKRSWPANRAMLHGVHGGQWLGPDAMVFLQWSIDGADGLAGFGSASRFFLLCWCVGGSRGARFG